MEGDDVLLSASEAIVLYLAAEIVIAVAEGALAPHAPGTVRSRNRARPRHPVGHTGRVVARYQRAVTYEEFVQRVRRHRPSELLLAVAESAIAFAEPAAWRAERIRLPWSLAAVAKASLVAGNEHRMSGVTEQDVLEACAAYNALGSPLSRQDGTVASSVGAFLVRTSQQQFPVQQSRFEEISRLIALFDWMDELDLEVMSSAQLTGLLGCPIVEFARAGFVIAVGASSSHGFFDPEWRSLWDGPEAIDSTIPMSVVRQVFHDHFLTTFADIRRQAQRWVQPDPALRHVEFNPLVGRPFVTLPDGRHLAPQPAYAFQRLSPASVYYAGVDALPVGELDAFTRDMGRVFESYVGRQLRLLPDATVVPEVRFDGDQRSVDWFVIFDDLVVLVEAKSTRLPDRARIGANDLEESLHRCLGKAFRQIDRTDHLLADHHPAFATIPTDRPRIGIVATLEPYWNTNGTFLRRFLPTPALPTTVASIREVEQLVTVIEANGGPEILAKIASDPELSAFNLGAALPTGDYPHNPILEVAWQRAFEERAK
jgi:hypothetical protein